jgi:hypothetical protein
MLRRSTSLVSGARTNYGGRRDRRVAATFMFTTGPISIPTMLSTTHETIRVNDPDRDVRGLVGAGDVVHDIT